MTGPNPDELEVFWTDPEYSRVEQELAEQSLRVALELDRNDRIAIIVLMVIFKMVIFKQEQY